jgi:hypothetical protein
MESTQSLHENVREVIEIMQQHQREIEHDIEERVPAMQADADKRERRRKAESNRENMAHQVR